MSIIQTNSAADLETVARELRDLIEQRQANSATVVALSGDLGAGKTTLVQFLAKTFGVTETVNSPTYVVMKSYPLDEAVGHFTKFIHLDAYRIEDIDEMRVLGFAELLEEKETIICIEWPEKISDLIPADAIKVAIEIEESGRRLTIT